MSLAGSIYLAAAVNALASLLAILTLVLMLFGLVFLFLGIAAGMMNVFRVVKGMGMAMGYKGDGRTQAKPGASDRSAGTENDWDED